VPLPWFSRKKKEVINYGNGVYYFPYKEDEFGVELSLFFKDHRELEFVSFTSNNIGTAGRTVGYFVIFRTKE